MENYHAPQVGRRLDEEIAEAAAESEDEESEGEEVVKIQEARQATPPTAVPVFVVASAEIEFGDSEPLVGHHEAPLRKMGSFMPNENGSVRTRGDHKT